MTIWTLNEAQQRLPELLEAARQGQSVEIIQQGQGFRLLALPSLPLALSPGRIDLNCKVA